jgi:hypothetical protein
MSERRARVPDPLEDRLDELLWQVAAEPDPRTERGRPLELGPERVQADVRRWMKARAAEGVRPRALAPRTLGIASPWLSAAAVVLALGGLGAAGYRDGWVEPRTEARQIDAGDAESWYVQVARAPDPVRPGDSADRCTSDSWYCVQARPASIRRDL